MGSALYKLQIKSNKQKIVLNLAKPEAISSFKKAIASKGNSIAIFIITNIDNYFNLKYKFPEIIFIHSVSIAINETIRKMVKDDLLKILGPSISIGNILSSNF